MRICECCVVGGIKEGYEELQNMCDMSINGKKEKEKGICNQRLFR